MAYYYVNKKAQDNGDHEVHTTGCSWLPAEHNRTYLGNFSSCGPAKAAAKSIYSTADGCYYCCRPCHKN